ncbi:MAG: transcription-repair coupling factor [Candidatus Cloacimonetes bacterium]|nr:transcription-repair coupling factor [Candidatus Cloacimonadota bacterium]
MRGTEGRFPSATYHAKPERRVAFLQRPITQSPNVGSLSFSDLSRKARTEGRFPSATYHAKPERRVAFLQRPITQSPNVGSLSFSDLSRKARTEGRFPSATYHAKPERRVAFLQRPYGNGIYSVSVRSLLRKISPPQITRDNIITLRKGEWLDPLKLMAALADIGYEIEYQVEKVFQAAKRGGIIDLFSPLLLKPCRLEFFGDEIISIRHFSLQTQRSESDELSKITILPAREIALSNVDSGSPIIARIRQSGFFDGIENYLSLLLPELSTFADYFDAGEVIFLWNNYFHTNEELYDLNELMTDQYARMQKRHSKVKLPHPDDLIAGEEFLSHLRHRSLHLYLSSAEYVLDFETRNISAPITVQNSYNGDLSLLAADIRHYQALGYQTMIQFDNQSQSKRMEQLLQDYDVVVDQHIGVLHGGFRLDDARLCIWTDHEIFNRYKRQRYLPRFSPSEALTDYDGLKPGDYVVHVDHGIGAFEGMKIIRLDGQDIECLALRYANDDRIYVPTFQLQLVSKYVAEEGIKPVLHRLGSTRWQNTKHKAKAQIELVAADIVRLYSHRANRQGIAHQPDTHWQEELEASFIYEDTVDQARASADIKQDMQLPAPMERLLCGDVGFGKTEVAIRAAFKAVCSGFQVAVLVPTTLLAEQHFRVFRERLAQYPVRLAMFSRFRSPAQIRHDLAGVAMGQIDIAIGTHRLLSKDVRFNALGLLVVDEEHRFGVRHKERLRRLQTNVDTLYMSATPIPRTLNMALARLKEISLMQTSPKERLPIRTIITPHDIEVIRDAIRREIDRGGQAFFIHNRVQTIENVALELRKAMPDIRFAVGHAQMTEHHLEDVMEAFVEHQCDVLIATTIIENGIDIPNANTILIDRADTFGLAQLYQMRGRVGRSNRRAYAYLLIPRHTTPEAKKRLEALTQYDYLGAGFQVALRDLEIRGAGTVLGTRQSGVIQAVGFNYYNHLLEKAVESVQNDDPELLWKDDFPEARQVLKTEIDLYFPPDYIADDQERLRIYRRLSVLDDLNQIDDFASEIRDRFGELPERAQWLIRYFALKILTKQANLHNCQVRHAKLLLDFKPEQLPPKETVLRFTSTLTLPFRIDLTKGLAIEIELDKNARLSYYDQFNTAVDLLRSYVGSPN